MKNLKVTAAVLVVAGALLLYVAGRAPGKPPAFPATQQNAAATQLVTLAGAAGMTVAPGSARADHEDAPQALHDYLAPQLERSGDAIDPLPAEAAAYLTQHQQQLDAMRDHLIASGSLEWSAEPMPNLAGLSRLSRLFVIRALDQAQHGNAAAWNELHAAWILGRDLWNRPETTSILVAVSNARWINAAARKMPTAKTPAWFEEVRKVDAIHALNDAERASMWRIWSDAPLYEKWQAASYLRKFAEFGERADGPCDMDRGPEVGTAMPETVSAYRRAARLRAEIEATDNVLRIRRGEMPETKSRCEDGSWRVTRTSFAFSRPIPMEGRALNVPLEYAFRSASVSVAH